MVKFNMFFPPRLLSRLRAYADLTGLSAADIVRRAVEVFLDGKGA